ncbi:MAG: CDP-diacylglycerol--glycerol-3-phosphate 3-phosphatidyltransferase [Candidatus Manganitrophus sp.]|nr:CDP-diacylglycerol--glycerol-3-phosphate 3-phosphatidyltransferase [Candidatus Manganitrophus sp.]WDT71913.1 MAG: CDP-diacylglycerol--glycerol-3-phosphate 3-phosphatidyltransferase [Candidatus Manganitrophus sp.]WDT75850.1 MAG: CDP-diacylglycerol--glycerol-3-phosphate 3-phosphatidyltransferase [Candidatus Manganitrophus sp.]WDT80689.1 MAG: CDP-diacylglycerol--glycerol-3-phosphate 3-phosphatidyltransferase [Candidatus Manganitrophus sp.]
MVQNKSDIHPASAPIPKQHVNGSVMNLPNILTMIRVVLIPFFIFFFSRPSTSSAIIAAVIFLVASLTDLLDGYLARRRKEVTQFGKFLDPVADKLLIVAALILLVANGRVPAWIAIVIIGREFAVTAFRAIASSEGVIIAAEGTGKYKMFLQTVAIIFLITDLPAFYFHEIGLFLLLIATALAIYSAGQYFIKFGRQVNLMKVK